MFDVLTLSRIPAGGFTERTAARMAWRPGPVAAAAMAAIVLGLTAPAAAQGGACRLEPGPRADLKVFRCPTGVTIQAEGRAQVEPTSGNDAALSVGAILVDVPRRPARGFQIRTPEAIASVRGTVWAVDVQPGKTSVFVQTGRVSVRRAETAAGAVTLSAGDGVDVEAGSTAPLTVKRWSAERAAALLARVGR